MSVVVQCPYCPNEITLPATATRATCPRCLRSFDADDRPTPPPSAPPANRHAAKKAHDEWEAADGSIAWPDWVNPWGVGAFSLATLGLLLASTLGVRSLTITLAALGIAVALVGILAGSPRKQAKDSVWLTAGLAVSGLILLITLTVPQLLNPFWAIDYAVPPEQPDAQQAVPRDRPVAKGKPLAEGDSVDAAQEAIRQNDVVIRLHSARLGQLADRGGKSFVLIHLWLGTTSYLRPIAFEGFTSEQHTPVLRDADGRTFAFREQRMRNLAAGTPAVFDARPGAPVEIEPGRQRQFQLVFEAPTGAFRPLTLELPSEAWGRHGACRFRIAEYFQANFPTFQER